MLNMLNNYLQKVMKSWTQMSLIQKVFVIVALVTIICSICTDCLLCKHWPITIPMSSQSMEESFQNNKEEPRIVLYYVPWCPHCKNVMPEWNKLEKEMSTEKQEENETKTETKTETEKVKVEKVNCEEKPEEAQKQNVEGFPTIILFKDGKVLNYEGERTMESLKEFIESN
jgi:thioredoxin-like negative regulator of GroEL